jgi:ribosomal protein S18 acetylase RimI-like enzyme
MPQTRHLVLRVRTGTEDDAGTLAELAARLFEQTFGDANDPEDMRSYLASAFSVDKQRHELGDARRVVWIAEDPAGMPIGYAMLRRGSLAPGVTASEAAEIERIYADREWHGRSVGSALMQVCLAQAREWKCDVIWLGVWEKNPRAIAFYEKNGFRAVGRQTFLLGRDVQHDLVMSLRL